jgi:peroxiredoxin
MKQTGLLLIILGISFFLAPTQSVATTKDKLSTAGFLPFKITEDAPEFTLNDTKNNPVNLKTYQGKFVLLFFWTTWCPSCRKEMPSLIELYDTFKTEGLVVLGINVGQRKEIVQKYMDAKKITFPVLCDIEGSVEQQYKVGPHPTHFLIDKQGKMMGKASGAKNWMNSENRYLIRSLLLDDSEK